MCEATWQSMTQPQAAVSAHGACTLSSWSICVCHSSSIHVCSHGACRCMGVSFIERKASEKKSHGSDRSHRTTATGLAGVGGRPGIGGQTNSAARVDAQAHTHTHTHTHTHIHTRTMSPCVFRLLALLDPECAAHYCSIQRQADSRRHAVCHRVCAFFLINKK